MLSEYITSLADVSSHIVAYMYARFRYSGKNPMRFAVFGVFLCGFAVFGPPLRSPPFNHLRLQLYHNADVVYLRQPAIHVVSTVVQKRGCKQRPKRVYL